MVPATTASHNLITTEESLRQILPPPHAVAADKTIDHIDDHCRSFIERSPFILIATSDGNGHFDVSPKGDPAGFVQILDATTLAIPERPGNHRADTFTNVLRHPHVGLIFLVPGVKTTLRVAGRASITDDLGLRESMALPLGGKADGKPSVPDLALLVHVEEAMLHCAKCIIRSNLWGVEAEKMVANAAGVSGLAEAMADHASIDWPTDKMRRVIERDEQENLY
ncbi:MAG: pyridoxamine 5'-phosphate oxidase family protein [Actinomycetota bacterium]|nr:pyridoxamine 5'-phosphate oxidase family protein [Actinomycetota bacterium]